MDLYDNKYFKPMLLGEIEKPFNDHEYLFELKFDGTRTLLYVEPKSILIKNRRGNILNDTYPELQIIKKMVHTKTIFDGEIVLMVDGKPSFKKLQERALLKDKIRINYFKENHPVVFICYDILYEGKDLTNFPLSKRKEILNKYNDNNFFIKTKFIVEHGKELYNFAKQENLEGIVAKKIDSKYLINKRSNDWLKIKNWMEEDFYIVAYNENTSSSMASIILTSKSKNKYTYVGKVTVGKKRSDFKEIKKIPKNKNILSDYENEEYTFIKPVLKCTVSFLEKTKNNHLRQPIYKKLKK